MSKNLRFELISFGLWSHTSVWSMTMLASGPAGGRDAQHTFGEHEKFGEEAVETNAGKSWLWELRFFNLGTACFK